MIYWKPWKNLGKSPNCPLDPGRPESKHTKAPIFRVNKGDIIALIRNILLYPIIYDNDIHYDSRFIIVIIIIDM